MRSQDKPLFVWRASGGDVFGRPGKPKIDDLQLLGVIDYDRINEVLPLGVSFELSPGKVPADRALAALYAQNYFAGTDK